MNTGKTHEHSTQRHIFKECVRERERERQRERDRETETETERDRERQRQRQTHRHTHIHTHTFIDKGHGDGYCGDEHSQGTLEQRKVTGSSVQTR